MQFGDCVRPASSSRAGPLQPGLGTRDPGSDVWNVEQRLNFKGDSGLPSGSMNSANRSHVPTQGKTTSREIDYAWIRGGAGRYTQILYGSQSGAIKGNNSDHGALVTYIEATPRPCYQMAGQSSLYLKMIGPPNQAENALNVIDYYGLGCGSPDGIADTVVSASSQEVADLRCIFLGASSPAAHAGRLTALFPSGPPDSWLCN